MAISFIKMISEDTNVEKSVCFTDSTKPFDEERHGELFEIIG